MLSQLLHNNNNTQRYRILLMLTTSRSGPFIKQFVGPGNNQIICFKFWQAVIASGCPGACSYCFLQTLPPYRRGIYDLNGTLFQNLADLKLEARRWLRKHKTPTCLILGENQDGLAFEGPYKKALNFTPLELLIPLFTSSNPVSHTLLILSKFTATQYAEAFGPSPNVVFSWSLSLPTIARDYEKKVASLEARLDHALMLKAKGYRVRFRLDALCPIPNWNIELDEIMSRINDIQPEMLTIGALRASSPLRLQRAAESNGRDPSVFQYLETKDPSGFKARTNLDFHTTAFRRIKQLLHPSISLGLCKEDISMWEAIGADWQGCHCLHSTEDNVTIERQTLLHQISSSANSTSVSSAALAPVAI